MIYCNNRRWLFAPLALCTVLVLVATCNSAKIKTVTELVSKGDRKLIWGTACKAAFCSAGICFDLSTRDKHPANAKITVETSLHTTTTVSATGHYCAEDKWMTYFMTMEVFVEPTQEDLVVSYDTYSDELSGAN